MIHNQKLSEAIVSDCRRRYAEDETVTLRGLAAELGVTHATLSSALKGETWSWVKTPTVTIRNVKGGNIAGYEEERKLIKSCVRNGDIFKTPTAIMKFVKLRTNTKMHPLHIVKEIKKEQLRLRQS